MSQVVTPEKPSRTQVILQDPSSGFIKFPITNKPQSRSCVCGDTNCGEISKSWRKLGDRHGTMLQLPTISNKRNQDQRIIKEGRLKQINAHLKCNSEGSFDGRCRSNLPPRSTRDATNQRQRKPKFFAVHHIDPIILSKLGVVDMVKLEFIKENGLWENGFTEADKVHHLAGDPHCYTVPSYSLESTKHDLQYVQKEEHLNAVIKKVVEGHRSNYRWRSNNPNTPEVNKEKRQKLTPVTAYMEDLEAAICMMHEQWEAFLKEGVPKDQQTKPPEITSNASIEKYMKGKNSPLTSLTITSDLFHTTNPHIAKLLFSFEDPRKKEDLIQHNLCPISGWELTKEFIFIMFGLRHEEPIVDLIEERRGRNCPLSSFEECILTLAFLENKFERQFLVTLFRLDHNLVGDVIIRWAPLFREVGCDLARLEITKDFLDKSYPQSYEF